MTDTAPLEAQVQQFTTTFVRIRDEMGR